MPTLMKIISWVCLLSFVAPEISNAQSAWGTLQVSCRKYGDNGCTASATACWEGSKKLDFKDKYIVAGSFQGPEILEFWNLKPSCSEPVLDDYIDVGGVKYPQGFCSNLYVESGSGLGSLGKKAYVKCRYRFEVKDLP